MCKINPDYGNKTCPVTGRIRKFLAPGTSRLAPGSARLAKKIRSLATWTYCLAYKLVKIADKLDPPPAIEPIPHNVREILKNNLATLDSPSCKLH